MRFIVASSASFIAVALIACTVTEYQNPPATRDGTEGTSGGSSGASLPDPSSTSEDTDENEPTKADGGKSGGKDASTPTTLPSGPTSGLDQSKKAGALTSTEKKQFCDWHAGINGGYGRSEQCDGGINVSGPKSQSDCVGRMPPSSCQATIAQMEACVKLDAADPCSLAMFKAPECAPLRTCAGL